MQGSSRVVSVISMSTLPLIDLGAFRSEGPARSSESGKLASACRDIGFFYLVNHGVDEGLQSRVEELSRAFFARPLDEKMKISMDKGGRAWRGYFPPRGELTSGRPDLKEGIYFGQELPPCPTPMHGPNLFPAYPADFREVVLKYMDALTAVGHAVMGAIALSLGLEETYFSTRYMRDPLILFRIFNYPPGSEEKLWGVGEHTDYGVLTLLKQDATGGLEVRSKSGWIEAKPIQNSFVCNLGDMLDRLTAGRYRSTPHRVRQSVGCDRLSFPFFFDPNFFSRVEAIPSPSETKLIDDKEERWDRSSVHEFQGTYGDYLLGKVSRVFPQLRKDVLP